MRGIILLLLLFSLVACGDKTQTENAITIDTANKLMEIKKVDTGNSVSNTFRFDTAYILSITHKPYLLTGFFNADNMLDTAFILRNIKTGKDALFIKHGGTKNTFLLKNGKDIGHDFDDFRLYMKYSG